MELLHIYAITIANDNKKEFENIISDIKIDAIICDRYNYEKDSLHNLSVKFSFDININSQDLYDLLKSKLIDILKNVKYFTDKIDKTNYIESYIDTNCNSNYWIGKPVKIEWFVYCIGNLTINNYYKIENNICNFEIYISYKSKS